MGTLLKIRRHVGARGGSAGSSLLQQGPVMPSPAGPPMTLGNMREPGVCSLAVTCELCHHEAVMLADRWPDAVLV